jgi:Putative phage tail protein
MESQIASSDNVVAEQTERDKPSTAMIPVHARPHPVSMEIVHAEFPAGMTIAEILGPEAKSCHVEIGGMTIPEEWWPRIRPKPGHAVVITRIPEGGNGKTILRVIAFAALAVGVILTAGSTSPLFASIAGALHVTTATVAGLAAAGLGLVGSLVINALIPPQSPSAASSSTADTSTNLLSSITGTSNQVNRYGAIPCAMGFVLYYPPYAALPYTELSGDDQYLRCLFDLGYGDPDPSDMKIGDTDLASYTDVETEIGTNPSLFSQDITEATAGDALNTDGNTATRTSSTASDELSIDLSFASGLFGVDSNGNNVSVTCKVKVEYAPTGTGSFTPVDASTSGLTISSSAATTNGDETIHVVNGERKAIRIGLRWKVTNGQYDIRVTRVSTDWGSAVSTAQVGDLTWTVIRSIRYSTVSTTGTKKLAMRIKATDQLSGNISQFNCILSQPVPVWHSDTGTWITEFSDNPAYIFRWLLRDCPANPRRIDGSRIADEVIKDWAAECDAKEFTYSASLDQATTLFALLQDVCAAGRATFNVRNGLYGVVRDEYQTTPLQVFTPRNSWSFGGNRAFPDAIHALRVQFINEEANYQQDERIVYDDGYGDVDMVAANPSLALATNFEQLTINGCTNANGAWRLGRYHLAVSRLRPNTYFWNADIENLVCNRGDLVLFANDVIGVGIAQGRVKEVTLVDPSDPSSAIASLTLDESVVGESGKTYAIRVRRSGGTVDTTQVTLTLGSPTNAFTLTTPLAGISQGDLVLFGELGHDSVPLVITKIEPSADLSAKITAVDAAFDVLNADAGTPPAWSSQITGQPWLDAPSPPDLLLIDSSQILNAPNDAGNTAPVMTVSIHGPWSGPIAMD